MLINSIWLIVLGILGAQALIIGKKPEAKQLIDKLAPIQGWLGVISAGWGIWWLIQILPNIGNLGLIGLIVSLGGCIAMILTGLLLGFGIISSFVKNEEAKAKMNAKLQKVAPYQGILGFVCIGLGVWALITVLTA